MKQPKPQTFEVCIRFADGGMSLRYVQALDVESALTQVRQLPWLAAKKEESAEARQLTRGSIPRKGLQR